MTRSLTFLSLLLAGLAAVKAQQVGTLTAENHPNLASQKCTKTGGCQTLNTKIVLDSNWRWTHTTSGSQNCYTGNAWDASLCPNPSTCAQNCAIDGADYAGTYGINTSGNELSLRFVTNGPYSKNIGSRVYLMENDTKYQMFKLKNQEFTFDVDVSTLPCGLNGALYFVEMDADGGLSKFPSNKAGAKYGTGYCDAQCPHDVKWISGEANVLDWTPSSTDSNAGTGRYGTCCAEMDIWEANSISTAFTPHPCSGTGPQRCSGTQCGDSPGNRYGGICDKDGCDFNSFRMGDTSFYGPGKTVNTQQKMTVVTQFITSDNTANGDLVEIRRIYRQNGNVIQNSKVAVPGIPAGDSITTDFCAKQKSVFGDINDHANKGGLKAMGDALQRGVVLVMSLWADHAAHMLWLDSTYPPSKPTTAPGVARGTCSPSSGNPPDVVNASPNATVKFSNIKVGDIGSTY